MELAGGVCACTDFWLAAGENKFVAVDRECLVAGCGAAFWPNMFIDPSVDGGVEEEVG